MGHPGRRWAVKRRPKMTEDDQHRQQKHQVSRQMRGLTWWVTDESTCTPDTLSNVADDNQERVAATQDAVAVMTAWLAQRQGDDLYHQQVDEVTDEHGELGTLRLATGLTNLCGFLVYRLARLQGQEPEEVLRDVARRIASA